jgi:alpha-glucosidase
MARSPFVIFNSFLLAIFTIVHGLPSPTAIPGGTATSTRVEPTLPASVQNGQNLLPNIYDPRAINPQNVCPGYKASNVVKTSHGMIADLSLAGAACNVYGTDIDSLQLTVEFQSEDRLHIEITPTYVGPQNTSWFVLPEVLVDKPAIDPNYKSRAQGSDLDFVWSNEPTFSFTVRRYSSGDVLFSTNGTVLVFENQFIEFGSPLPENYNLYGLGEVIHGLRMGNNFTRTLYAADVGDPVDRNIYGDHAFYLDTRYFEVDESNGQLTYIANATNATASYKSFSHGVYLRNSHGQEILMRPSNITWRTLGGNIDLYFYAGPTQKEVTTAYQKSTVGLPAMQQYFGFGYHQCRWGYQNWSVLQEMVDNFAKFSLPLDNIWTDIDYMNQYRDFENDQNRFGYAEGAKFLSGIHANDQHYIPIVDSAIYIPNSQNASDAYPSYDRGNAVNAFMLNPDGSQYIGAVWPGYTVFPDWIGAALAGGGAFDWWTAELAMWHQNISFDGIWIDMSEVSSFCVGSCGSGKVLENPVAPPFSLPGAPGSVIYDYPEGFNLTNATEASSASAASSSQAASVASAATASGPTPTSTTPYLTSTPTPGVRNINYPPYVINNVQGDLAVHAVSPNATHHDGSVEYEYHNLFGHQILNATYHALLNIFPTKRPFIIGRSTFAGSGKWAGHWGGDNTSQFFYMMMSIPQGLSFSLFGIPMFGVDTCGFSGNADEELCNRWMQLSAFFPFYRNHNVRSAISQEPYIWSSVIEATKVAATIRYTLLPYIYTTFYLAHTTGSTVMRALAWEFPDDPTLASADRQFLLGSSLMITPVLTQGAVTVDGVFPGVGSGEVWYDWYNQSAVTVGPGENITIDAPLGHIPVYVRGASILPIQEPALTTVASRRNPWGLLVALSSDGAASGSLYVDDGESLQPNATLWVEVCSVHPSLPFLAPFSDFSRSMLTPAQFEASSGKLSAVPQGSYSDTNALANVTIMGVSSQPRSVSFNGTKLSSGWSYNSSSKVLAVTQLNSATRSGAWAAPWSLSWS